MRRTPEQFIIEAKQIHGERYDYSQTDYVIAREHVKIICRKHGVFIQRPDHHLRKSGCPLCNKTIYYNERTVFSEFFNNKKGILYIIRLFDDNEEFFKVGITIRDLKFRLKEFNYLYNVEILMVQKEEFKKVFTFEQKILKKFTSFKYKPLKYFKGNSECFSVNPLNYYYESN